MATPSNEPKFRTPDPEELQSEETRSEMRDRYLHENEADLSNPDQVAQTGDDSHQGIDPDQIARGEATDSTLNEEGGVEHLANRQMEITNRSAG